MRKSKEGYPIRERLQALWRGLKSAEPLVEEAITGLEKHYDTLSPKLKKQFTERLNTLDPMDAAIVLSEKRSEKIQRLLASVICIKGKPGEAHFALSRNRITDPVASDMLAIKTSEEYVERALHLLINTQLAESTQEILAGKIEKDGTVQYAILALETATGKAREILIRKIARAGTLEQMQIALFKVAVDTEGEKLVSRMADLLILNPNTTVAEA